MYKEVNDFAARITEMGFTVYIAEREAYGFITDNTESRVLSFSFNDNSLSGNYGPPSTQSGTGWRMDIQPHQLTSHKQVNDALYAMPPSYSRNGWRYMTTVKQYLSEYGISSRFFKFTNERS